MQYVIIFYAIIYILHVLLSLQIVQPKTDRQFYTIMLSMLLWPLLIIACVSDWLFGRYVALLRGKAR